MREEGLCQTDCRGVVGEELCVESVDVDGGGVGEIERALDTGVDEDAVEVGV